MVGFTFSHIFKQDGQFLPSHSELGVVCPLRPHSAQSCKSCFCKKTVTGHKTKFSGVTMPHSSVQTALGCPAAEEKSGLSS